MEKTRDWEGKNVRMREGEEGVSGGRRKKENEMAGERKKGWGLFYKQNSFN